MEPTAASTLSTNTTREPTDRDERVPIGRVVGVHGLRGELRVRIDGGDIDNLSGASEVWLASPDGASSPQSFVVSRVSAGRSGEFRVALKGVSDRSASEPLRGATISVRADDLPTLGPDEYYAYELVGCSVEDMAGDVIGNVSRIWETGAQDLLVVQTSLGLEHLIPIAAPILHRVDLPERRVVVDPPPGLLDDPKSS